MTAMKQRFLLPMLAASAGLVSSCNGDGPELEHTNFVIINFDDVGYGDFSYNGAYGYTTPNIDRMAAEGVQFTHCLASQPVSGASRAGLLTGCYPNRIGFHGAPNPGAKFGINQEEMTIAEVLKQKDYATAIFGKWHLGDARNFLPLQNGFDEWYGLPYSNDMWPHHPQRDYYPDLPLYDGNEIIGYNTDQNRFTTDYTEHAVSFIKRNAGKPFFLYLAHNMAHVPLAVSDKFRGKSEQGLYGDVMMELDWSVGQVLSTLDSLKLLDNTLVILTTDNGPWLNYGNHAGSTAGLREGKGTTFDGGNRVPCIMYWKGKTRPGTVCNKLASHIDFLPTFAEIAGVPLPPRKIDGVSILPLVLGDNEANPRSYYAYYYRVNDLEAVTNGKFKLVFPHSHRTYGAFPPGKDGKPGEVIDIPFEELSLFDLRRDPGERYNVIDEYPEEVAGLQEFAAQMRASLGDNLTGEKGSERRKAGRRTDAD